MKNFGFLILFMILFLLATSCTFIEQNSDKNTVYNSDFISPVKGMALSAGYITLNYNRDEAIEYAKNNYSDEVHSEFPHITNDCAHFVSRCLYAGGGLPMIRVNSTAADGIPPWWYKQSGSYGNNFWSSCRTYYQIKFLKKFFNTTLITAPANTDILAGNPVYYDWDGNGEYEHVAFCVVSGTSTVTALVCGHNPVAGNKDWKSLQSPGGNRAKAWATIKLKSSVTLLESSITPYQFYPYSF